MSICYDLRFPNMFRKLAKTGSIFISIPSAFTKTTGEKHWHTLLRPRAIENFCYVFAPAQSGIHYNKRVTYGHSLIISPDGKIIAEKAKGEGIISANIDRSFSDSIAPVGLCGKLKMTSRVRLLIARLNRSQSI